MWYGELNRLQERATRAQGIQDKRGEGARVAVLLAIQLKPRLSTRLAKGTGSAAKNEVKGHNIRSQPAEEIGCSIDKRKLLDGGRRPRENWNHLNLLGGHVKKRQASLIHTLACSLCKDQRSAIGCPRGILTSGKRRSLPSICWHDANIKLSHLRGECDHFTIRRPRRIGRVDNPFRRKPEHRPAFWSGLNQPSSAARTRSKAQPLTIRGPNRT